MHRNIRKLSADQHINLIRTKKSAFWQNKEKARRVHVTSAAAKRVPAYKKFLQQRGIKSLKDWKNIPATDKKTYLSKFSLSDLCWDGHLTKPLVFTSTSGSTGKPFYFPREEQLDWQASIIHESFLLSGRQARTEPTLIVVCFSMGIWIGGLITYQAFEMTREKGYPISIATPGLNKVEIFKILKRIAPQFKHLILVGYPPFIKDIIDEAPEHRVNLKRMDTRIIFAAESFPENFREYIGKKLQMKDTLIDTMNIYGSADIGAMAFETPISILLRRIAISNQGVYRELFGKTSRLPTLAQYNPLFLSFEEVGGELYITGDSAIPLIKYRIGDHGGVFDFTEAIKRCKKHGIDLLAEAKKAGIKNLVTELPFVYVYERLDLSTTIYGLQVYPETIREILIKTPFGEYLTGKCTLITRFNRASDQYLEINLELKKGKKISGGLKKKLLSAILVNLFEKNAEFKELYTFLGKRALPKLIFWPYNHPLHFTQGVKQRWSKK